MYAFRGGASTCLVCCRLLFFCGWLEHVPCLLYVPCLLLVHICTSCMWVEGVCFQPPNFLRWSNFPKFSAFPVGISRIFSTTPLILGYYFPRWYFENFLTIFPVGISRIFSTTCLNLLVHISHVVVPICPNT